MIEPTVRKPPNESRVERQALLDPSPLGVFPLCAALTFSLVAFVCRARRRCHHLLVMKAPSFVSGHQVLASGCGSY